MKKIFILLTIVLTLNVQAQLTKSKLKVVKRPPYTQMLFQHENIFIGPQPQFNDFATIKKAGFTKVINTRTPEEMEKLKFYEDYLLKKNNIEYVFIPIGGEKNPYSPEKLAEFAKALENNEGKVLLHCRSGHRASQLWAAYLVKYKGKSIDEALQTVSKMGWWPMPMESLLGKKLHVTIEE